jgi:hypothetical protein
MQPRTLALMAIGVFALCSSDAMAQGHAGGYRDAAVKGSAVGYTAVVTATVTADGVVTVARMGIAAGTGRTSI